MYLIKIQNIQSTGNLKYYFVAQRMLLLETSTEITTLPQVFSLRLTELRQIFRSLVFDVNL